ncbi:unnamed protein product [Effrenium voratum]|uniref:Inner centromere protein ARK-binding domain-containing protein n=1 Tax=Effrenium voratum TaxID=2562239 RepID=A0AA36HZ60_9DINO|nr:unnamed protein product [Effrenium voratum]
MARSSDAGMACKPPDPPEFVPDMRDFVLNFAGAAEAAAQRQLRDLIDVSDGLEENLEEALKGDNSIYDMLFMPPVDLMLSLPTPNRPANLTRQAQESIRESLQGVAKAAEKLRTPPPPPDWTYKQQAAAQTDERWPPRPTANGESSEEEEEEEEEPAPGVAQTPPRQVRGQHPRDVGRTIKQAMSTASTTPEVLRSGTAHCLKVKEYVKQLEEVTKDKPPLMPIPALSRSSLGTKAPTPRHGPHAQEVVPPPPPKAPMRKASMPSQASLSPPRPEAFGSTPPRAERAASLPPRPEAFFSPPAKACPFSLDPEMPQEREEHEEREKREEGSPSEARSQRSRRSAVCSDLSEKQVSERRSAASSTEMALGPLDSAGLGLGAQVLQAWPGCMQDRIKLRMDHDLSSPGGSEHSGSEALREDLKELERLERAAAAAQEASSSLGAEVARPEEPSGSDASVPLAAAFKAEQAFAAAEIFKDHAEDEAAASAEKMLERQEALTNAHPASALAAVDADSVKESEHSREPSEAEPAQPAAAFEAHTASAAADADSVKESEHSREPSEAEPAQPDMASEESLALAHAASALAADADSVQESQQSREPSEEPALPAMAFEEPMPHAHTAAADADSVKESEQSREPSEAEPAPPVSAFEEAASRPLDSMEDTLCPEAEQAFAPDAEILKAAAASDAEKVFEEALAHAHAASALADADSVKESEHSREPSEEPALPGRAFEDASLGAEEAKPLAKHDDHKATRYFRAMEVLEDRLLQEAPQPFGKEATKEEMQTLESFVAPTAKLLQAAADLGHQAEDDLSDCFPPARDEADPAQRARASAEGKEKEPSLWTGSEGELSKASSSCALEAAAHEDKALECSEFAFVHEAEIVDHPAKLRADNEAESSEEAHCVSEAEIANHVEHRADNEAESSEEAHCVSEAEIVDRPAEHRGDEDSSEAQEVSEADIVEHLLASGEEVGSELRVQEAEIPEDPQTGEAEDTMDLPCPLDDPDDESRWDSFMQDRQLEAENETAIEKEEEAEQPVIEAETANARVIEKAEQPEAESPAMEQEEETEAEPAFQKEKEEEKEEEDDEDASDKAPGIELVGHWRGESISPERRKISSNLWHILRTKPLPPPKAEDNYEMSSAGEIEQEDEARELELAEKRQFKHSPRWCDNYLNLVQEQGNWDADTVFGQVPPCDLDEVFPDSLYKELSTERRYKKRRGSSGHWGKDRLKSREVDIYKSKLGQRKAFMPDLEALSPSRSAFLQGEVVSRARASASSSD